MLHYEKYRKINKHHYTLKFTRKCVFFPAGKNALGLQKKNIYILLGLSWFLTEDDEIHWSETYRVVVKSLQILSEDDGSCALLIRC